MPLNPRSTQRINSQQAASSLLSLASSTATTQISQSQPAPPPPLHKPQVRTPPRSQPTPHDPLLSPPRSLTTLISNGEECSILSEMLDEHCLKKNKCGTYTNRPITCLFHKLGDIVTDPCASIVKCSNKACLRTFHFRCYSHMVSSDNTVRDHVTTVVKGGVAVVHPVCGRQCMKFLQEDNDVICSIES